MKVTWKGEDRKSLHGCTSEGCNFVIECLTCRREGKRRRYYGETSRSPYQRGQEHSRDIAQGVATHPLVAHFVEEHNGTTLGNPDEGHLTSHDSSRQTGF